MKYYLSIISAFIILFSSCSKEDDILIDTSEQIPQLCVKRTVNYSSEWNVNSYIYEYNYDKSRLLDWTLTRIDDNSTEVTTFVNTYSGANIISLLVTRSTGITVYDFEYDNLGRVIKQFKDSFLEFTYVYNGYSVEKYNSDSILIEEQLYDDNNNLILNKTKRATDSTWTWVYNYQHDNMNMPFKNVDSWYPLSSFRYISSNNTVKVEGNSFSSNVIMDISYDFNNFPEYIEYVYTDGKSKSEILEYNR